MSVARPSNQTDAPPSELTGLSIRVHTSKNLTASCNLCKACKRKMKKTPAECPVDRQQLRLKQDTFEDKAAERLILSFVIKCPNEGCQWQGELGNFKDHTCTPICADFTVTCPNKCGKRMKRNEISNHVISDCAMTFLPCIYHRLGCNIKTPRKNMDEHMESNITHHFNITCERLLSLEDENRKLRTNQKQIEQQCKNLKANFQNEEGKKKEIADLKNDMEQQSEQMNRLDKNLQTLKSQKGELTKELKSFKKEMKQQDNKQTANLETVKTDTEELAQEMKWSRSDMTMSINTLRNQLFYTRKTFEKKWIEFDSKVQRNIFSSFWMILLAMFLIYSNLSSESQKNSENCLGELKRGLNQVNSRLSHKFIFNVENFVGILKQAKNRRDDNVHRVVFYTKKYGYKLKVTVYPNGYGRGRNTHVSLYVQIVRGQYDAILPWPFTETIKISILDQKEDVQQRKNVDVMINPKKIALKYFQRPVTASNERYGFDHFVSHKQLEMENFLSSGSLFVKIEFESI